MAQSLSFNLKDRSRPATITSVDPQNKRVSVKFTQQDGEVPKLDLAYQNVGATWGRLYMPQIGDRVYIDYTQGELPVLVGMKPTNPEFLPYLDPGEIADTNSDGSFIHLRNKRRRVKSTGELIDYNALKGPNGETDIETEPGGIVFMTRSKKDINSKTPHWDEHSYISMFDNGDVAIQSRYKSKEKGLLFFDGSSGYSIWAAGNGRPQSYIEQDTLNKRITHISSGDMHYHTHTDWKRSIYGNDISSLAGGMQLNLGKDATKSDPVKGIPPNFDKLTVDSDVAVGDYRIRQIGKFLHVIKDRFEVQVGPDAFTTTPVASAGDMYFDNTSSAAGRFIVNVLSDAKITVQQGNFALSVETGTITVTANGNITLNTLGDTTIKSTGNTFLDAKNIYLNNDTSTDPIITKKDLDTAIQAHTHPGVQSGTGITGLSAYATAVPRKVFA